MNTIKWVNDTFVPWGMKPIEDLPEAIPGQGNSCVIAKVLKDNFPDFENVQVGSASIDFNIYLPNEDVDSSQWIQNDAIKAYILSEEGFLNYMPMPPELTEFIREFDGGRIPELIDEDGLVCEIGEWEAHNLYRIGCTHNDQCEYCQLDRE